MSEHFTKIPATPANQGWRSKSRTYSHCYEWTGFEHPPAELGVGAELQGAVCRRTDGTVISLHPAPDRWLVPDPPPGLLAALERAELDGKGVRIEVTRRWRTLSITPLDTSNTAPHPLSAAMPLALVLARRRCASLWAFDCPVIVAITDDGYDVWIEASYEWSFTAMLATLGVRA